MNKATLETYFDLDENFLEHLPKDKNSKILDFGCGNGRVLRYLLTKGYSQVTGVDKFEHEKEWEELQGKVKLTQISSAEEYLNSNKNAFDCIIVKDVIYYFDASEIVNVADRVSEALKPSGTVIFEIFNGAILTGPYIKYKDIGIKVILTEQSIKQIIVESGLELKEVYGNRQKAKGIKSSLFLILNGIWRAAIKIIFFLERGNDEQNPKILTKKIIAIAKKRE